MRRSHSESRREALSSLEENCSKPFLLIMCFWPYVWFFCLGLILFVVDLFFRLGGTHLYEYIPTDFYMIMYAGGIVAALLGAIIFWVARGDLRSFAACIATWLVIVMINGFTQGSLITAMSRAAGGVCKDGALAHPIKQAKALW